MSLTCCLSQEKAIPESVARAVSDLRAACPMKKEEQESVALAVSDKSLYWRVLPELSLTCCLSPGKAELESVDLAVSDLPNVPGKRHYWRVLPELSLTCCLGKDQGSTEALLWLACRLYNRCYEVSITEGQQRTMQYICILSSAESITCTVSQVVMTIMRHQSAAVK
jgi:hypothetical protein